MCEKETERNISLSIAKISVVDYVKSSSAPFFFFLTKLLISCSSTRTLQTYCKRCRRRGIKTNGVTFAESSFPDKALCKQLRHVKLVKTENEVLVSHIQRAVCLLFKVN